MVRWLDFVRGAAGSSRHPSRIERNSKAQPHEKYLWDTGFHFGEWLEPQPPGTEFDFGALMRADKGDVATAYFRRSTQLMARIAAVLGKQAEARTYRQLSERIRDAWCLEFLDGDGLVAPPTQANCVRALAFELVPEEGRQVVADQLARLVRNNDNHLGTGFLSTGMLLPALADNGHADVAFDLLQQRTWPSWLAMIDKGATTTWERWEGWDGDGMPHESHNHFSKGAVITFLHRYVAGIRPVLDAPAYRRFEIRPIVGGGITSATGRLETPYGVIESSWRLADDIFTIDVTVPTGTNCRMVLPDGITHGVLAGTHRFTARMPA
jgi:alpha-L-rhamnosidase